MRRILLILATTWSVAGAPAFCRAGVWVECCRHEADPAAPRERAEYLPTDDCCPVREPAQKPLERRCASCVFACGGVAKLTDDVSTTDWAHPIAVSIDLAAWVMNDAGPAGCFWVADRSDPSGLPFPRSDIPLLI